MTPDIKRIYLALCSNKPATIMPMISVIDGYSCIPPSIRTFIVTYPSDGYGSLPNYIKLYHDHIQWLWTIGRL